MTEGDPFFDAEGRPQVLAGVAIYSASPRFAELAGRSGFDAVWIDMEHASLDLAGAEAMCVATEAGGAVPIVRCMGYERDHILRALEIGGRIIVCPMTNDADAARKMVEYGKYRPLGRRGFYRYSRGLRFGQREDWLEQANARTVLLPQIETLEAVRNIDGILGVEGISGILIGPGDLSADMGKPGNFEDPELVEMICECLRKARGAGRHAGILPPALSLMKRALAAGADLCVFASDLKPMLDGWQAGLETFRGLARKQA